MGDKIISRSAERSTVDAMEERESALAVLLGSVPDARRVAR